MDAPVEEINENGVKNLDYYKSLVSDEEVAKALIEESKTKIDKNDRHIFKPGISNSIAKDMDDSVEESNANGVKNLDYYISLVSDEEVEKALIEEGKTKIDNNDRHIFKPGISDSIVKDMDAPVEESNANGVKNLDYYKSLVSDEEVVAALLKESKAKEMELVREKARVRPNIIFLQRTVSNMVSSNKRVGATNKSAGKEIEKSANKNGTKVKKKNLQSRSEPARFSKQSNSESQVERTYGESLDKYFVREAGNSTKSSNVHSQKPKNIVLNLNFNGDKCTTTLESNKISKTASSSILCSDNDVIWVPPKIKVICVSDSDSD